MVWEVINGIAAGELIGFAEKPLTKVRRLKAILKIMFFRCSRRSVSTCRFI